MDNVVLIGLLLGGVMALIVIAMDKGCKKFFSICFEKSHLQAHSLAWGVVLGIVALIFIPLLAKYTGEDPGAGRIMVVVAVPTYLVITHLYCFLRKQEKRTQRRVT